MRLVKVERWLLGSWRNKLDSGWVTALFTVLVVCSCGVEAPRGTTALTEHEAMVALGGNAKIDLDRGVLVLPPGASADWYVSIPERSAISMGEIKNSNVGNSRVTVTINGDDFDALNVAEIGRPDSRRSIQLPRRTAGAAKVTFHATKSDSRPHPEGSWAISDIGIEYPLTLQLPRTPRSSGTEEAAQTNLVIYVADALRRDHVGVYGGASLFTPNIDAFARESVVFDRAVAQSPWTRPSITSLFTGLEPQFHDVHDREDSLADDAVTVAEILANSGYFTAAVSGNGNISRQFGLAQGFDVFSPPGKNRNSSEQVTARTFEVLNSNRFRSPFFLFIHNLDPHHPYVIRGPEFERLIGSATDPKYGTQDYLAHVKGGAIQPTASEQENTHRLYLAEVAYMDREFGRVLSRLKEMGLYENSLIVFLSDHGEEFWDHEKWGHGETFYTEVIEVPLIVKPPRGTGTRRIAEIVQHTDIFATLVDYAGLEPTAGNRVLSLRSYLEGTGQQLLSFPRQALSHLALGQRYGKSITEANWRLSMRGPNLENVELFEHNADPSELRNLAGDRPITVEFLKRSITQLENSSSIALQSQGIDIDPELEEQLRALGYLN